jgi:flagellar protein FlaG
MEANFISLTSGVSKVNAPKPPQQAAATDGETRPAAKTQGTRDVEGTTPAVSADADKPKVVRLYADEKKLDELVDNLNQHIQATNRALQFSVHEKYGRPIISVIDKETDEVIRQIPPEVALQVADALEDVAGALVSERA